MSVGTAGAIQAPPASAGVLGQGISYPCAYTVEGRLKLSWGQQSVLEAITSICRTQPHERVMLQGYGAGSITFEPIDLARFEQLLARNIAEYEPRARNVDIKVRPGNTPGSAFASIQFSTSGDATPRTLTVPLFVGPAVTGASY